MATEANIHTDIAEIIEGFERDLTASDAQPGLLTNKEKEMLNKLMQMAWNRGYKKGWAAHDEFEREHN